MQNDIRFVLDDNFILLQIALLQNESEVPIEELLARYRKVCGAAFDLFPFSVQLDTDSLCY